ncbi:hypothetical protein CVT24_004308 [Panaeolus cyanescens]|uniref:Uncharacterized protein n=1 Tax=Panaeolus cyanescens TaxID=181874 RepID=A0A409X0C4_9AGAR|nr:hypothetical protein CVT24_004308 [Panaeolus cyanescens]
MYDGHVALSCDDTKLLPALRLFYDHDNQCHFLIGGTEGPIRVADPNQVQTVLAELQVRFWCLTLPSPKIPPVLVAAVPIGDDLTVHDLFPLLKTVIDGLIDHDIRIVSYASDGSEVERGVQERLLTLGEKTVYVIKNPHHNRPDTCIRFTIYRGQAICIVQDSKHALKTFRNKLFSGARFLILFNYNATYRRIRRILDESGSIRKRDVKKLDRQDDNAAARLFSAATLEHLVDNHKDDALGEIVYLFALGELVDAFQNRSMKHSERLQIALRSRYFLDSWDAYLKVCQYPKGRFHISREGLNILDILIESLIALIMHLRLKIREAVLNTHTSNSKESAAGLSHFPLDAEIQLLAKAAADEADSLVSLLGVNPVQLFAAHSLTVKQCAHFQPGLLSIDSWFKGSPGDSASNASDLEFDTDSDESDSGEELSESRTIQQLLELEERSHLAHSHKDDVRMENLTLALVSVLADDASRAFALAEEDETSELKKMADADAEHVQLLQQELQNIRRNIAVPHVTTSHLEPQKPYGLGGLLVDSLGLSTLVSLRKQHQTRHAALGIRTRIPMTSKCKEAESTRAEIRREMEAVLKQYQDVQGIGTELERSHRWRAPAPGGRDAIMDGEAAPQLRAGTSTNAGAVAEKSAKEEIQQKRANAFKKASVEAPYVSRLASAQIIIRSVKWSPYTPGPAVKTEHMLPSLTRLQSLQSLQSHTLACKFFNIVKLVILALAQKRIEAAYKFFNSRKRKKADGDKSGGVRGVEDEIQHVDESDTYMPGTGWERKNRKNPKESLFFEPRYNIRTSWERTASTYMKSGRETTQNDPNRPDTKPIFHI